MPLILGTNSIKDTGFNVSNSLRFDDGSSDYLYRSLGSQSSLRIGTFSYWVKRSSLGIGLVYFNEVENDNNRGYIQFESDDTWRMVDNDSSGDHIVLKTNRLFRDFAAWYHICVRVDTTQSTSTDRVRLYVNGVQETSFSSTTYPSQNDDLKIFQGGQTNKNNLGAGYPAANYYDGYMAEFVYCDGQSLGPDSFGEFDSDSGIWKPINVSGLTFGNNGFYLQFKESGTSQNSSGLGADTSGNNNHFAVNNLTALDQSQDTCTNNFCTLNSLYYHSTTFTYSEGNTKATTGAAWKTAGGTIGMNSGKWYWEFTKSGSYVEVGIGDLKGFAQGGSNYQGLSHTQDTDAIGIYYNSSNGEIYSNNTSGAETNPGAYGASWDTEVIGCALDLDSSQNTVTFYKANSSQGAWNIQDPVEGYTPSFTIYNSNATVNFGGTQTVALSSAESDENGFGSFEYAPPSGFLSICTKNLAENS